MTASTDIAAVPATHLLDLTGRTAVVTGGAMGIGLAIVRRLHEVGANVVVADRSPATANVAAALEATRAGSAVGLHADVSLELDAHRVTGAAVEHFGAIDILVNNAGIYPQRPVMEMDTGLFRKVLDVNLTGLFLCSKAAAERMIDRDRGGRIINITSIDALHPSMVGLAHYDASKHGAWGFTKSLALELAPHGIWVNAIAPGGIATPGVGDMSQDVISAFEQTIPMGRMGDPDEIARATLFLASDLSSYMTGSQIVVDGGKLLA
jgi:2-dehydro-3-deoxy-D-gluconate 5-dehydrogenase